MSKSTETTNDRVPRVLVRFGKHPPSVGKRGGVPRRAGLSERGDAGRCRRGVGTHQVYLWSKSTDEVLLNCLDLRNISIYVGRTGVRPNRIILIKRPRDGGITIIRDGDGITESVTYIWICCLDFL